VAGVGTQGRSRSFDPQPGIETALNSPWDLWLHDEKLYIAMAGPHQIWVWDSKSGEVAAFAGSGHEDIEDGDLPMAAFAQPSGLTSDGDWLYVADSEGSSIRAVPLIPEKEVWTVVGTAGIADGRRLFVFGDVDGENGAARLQHPLGVAWHNGALYVADTYNNKLRVIDPEKRTITSLVGDAEPGRSDNPARFDEPSGLCAAGEKLYVADTNNHAIRVVDLKTLAVQTLLIEGLSVPRPRRSQTTADFPNAEQVTLDRQNWPSGGKFEMRLQFQLPGDFKLSEQAPVLYQVENIGSVKIVAGDTVGSLQSVKPDNERIAIELPTGNDAVDGAVRLSLTFYTCLEGAGGICQVRSMIYEIPVELSSSGSAKHADLVVRPSR
jgi:hypothetical protein